MTLQIKQDFDYKSEGYWLWSVWINGKEEEINNIASVRYTLHPSYTPAVRIVKNQSAKFLLCEEAYEEFTIYATVTFQKDRSEERLEHTLSFAKISVKNNCQLIEKSNDFQWELSIEGEDTELDKIQRVSYQFLGEERVIEDRASNFKITGRNNHKIHVSVNVYFKDGRKFEFEELLRIIKLTNGVQVQRPIVDMSGSEGIEDHVCEFDENQIYLDDIQRIKENINSLIRKSDLYSARELLNSTRNKQRELRQTKGNKFEQEWWQVREVQDEVWVVQRLVLCIYKDEELPAKERLDQAINLVGGNWSAQSIKLQHRNPLSGWRSA